MDLGPCRFATWDELRRYCYHVAGTVGLLVAPILGCQDDAALPHAVDLGIAMQLTNILRDVGEDARRGRLYLPLDELAAFGCDPEAILSGRPSGRFRELLSPEIERERGGSHIRGKVGDVVGDPAIRVGCVDRPPPLWRQAVAGEKEAPTVGASNRRAQTPVDRIAGCRR